MNKHAVLVVDDEPASRRALRRVLASEYTVLAASDGSEALRVLDQHAVAVVITDQRMPGMSGVELLTRSAASHPDLIRIVLTAYADIDPLIEAINAGALFYYLTKPWEPGELLLAVRRGIERCEARREQQRLLRMLEASCVRARREADRSARLLATAAHELGTPLHIVGNAVDLLGALPAVGSSEWFAAAQRGLAWLRRSLAQIRSAVHLSAPDIHLKPRRIDLSAGVEAAVTAMRAAIEGRTVALTLGSLPALWVRGDERWLRQVWIELLSNGVRFTPDGGAVAITAAATASGVCVEVTDTGLGMTAVEAAAAFDSFSPVAGDMLLHASGRFQFGARGLGLGLWTARRIVELHRGSIQVETSPGRGSRFSVLLPAA